MTGAAARRALPAAELRPSAELRLPAQIAEELLRHARGDLPNEACGLLAGDAGRGQVLAYHPARNEHASPFRFSLDAGDLVRITYAIEAAGQDLLAIFHSHPNGEPRPSTTDLREARYPMAMHLLAGLRSDLPADGQAASMLRAWRIADGTPVEVDLRID
jgi:proteasome lid subunit RPN8/RPN11